MDYQYEEMVDFLSVAKAKAAWIFTWSQVGGGAGGLVLGMVLSSVFGLEGKASAIVIIGGIVLGAVIMSSHLGLPIWRWFQYGSRYLVRRQRQQHKAGMQTAQGVLRPARVIDVTDAQGRPLLRCWQDAATDESKG